MGISLQYNFSITGICVLYILMVFILLQNKFYFSILFVLPPGPLVQIKFYIKLLK